MKLCQTDYNFSLKLEGSCGDCALKRVREKKTYARDEIIPPKLCPSAYHVIIPYWVALKQVAWFRWQKNKGSVTCQCPQPRGIVFLVRKGHGEERLAIEVEVTGVGDFPCRYHYAAGDIFRTEPDLCPALFPSLWAQVDTLAKPNSKELEIECCLRSVSFRARRGSASNHPAGKEKRPNSPEAASGRKEAASFPSGSEELAGSGKSRLQKIGGQHCPTWQQATESPKVKVVDFRAPCFFFRRRGEEFTLDKLTPKGICPDLFFHIYPQYLSLLYGGQPYSTKPDGPREAVLRCPGSEGKTTWRVRSKKLLLSPLINFAENLFRLTGRPKDLFDRKIILKLLQTEEICPFRYSEKVSFSLNQYSRLWGKFPFCPALFYTIYPFLISGEELNAREGGPLRLQCPAENCAITVELIKKQPASTASAHPPIDKEAC